MRSSARILSSLAVVSLLAACGSSGGSDGASDATTPTDVADTAADSPSDSPSADSASADSTSTDSASADSAPEETGSADAKPEVSIPSSLPTELAVTELRAGDGTAASNGDTLVLDYVGVRAEDGTEFDTSWGKDPFTVVLGSGQVISGWDQGLVGTESGGRYQLDIPADLAYADQGAGDIIKPGDALTFVVDIRKVITPSAAEDQPEIDAPTSTGATEVVSEDLVDGTGAEVKVGDSLYLELVAYRGDTGEQVDTSWGAGGPWMLVIADGQALPGLVTGVPGMKVGGRRQIVIPAADAFADQGSDDGKIPANTDLVVVIDAVYAY